MICIAHTKDGQNFISEEESQTLETHLLNVATYAECYAEDFGAKEAGRLIGLLHDYGKYSEAFQEKIRGKTIKTSHAMAGAYLNDKNGSKDFIRHFYGLLIASHHTGMYDFNPSENGYDSKLKMFQPGPFHEPDTSILQLIPSQVSHKCFKPTKHKKQISFAIALYLKMLFSSLVDADYTDTEEFCSGIKRQPIPYSIDHLYELLSGRMPQNDGKYINNIRAGILKNCLERAEDPQGLFSLTVPTGGGKTISSLAFALKHAKNHNLSRIIYVIPYTSIIEQNAKVFKELIGEDYVLEHHSNILHDSEDFRSRWATENWDIPITVTTNVQFFESIFSNRPSQNRKLHNIANSVIIFDEAQMLPKQYLSPSLYAISELVVNYKVTAVLCSATQPRITNYIYKDLPLKEIIENPLELAQKLKRVRYQNIGGKSNEEIISLLLQHESGLLIVNSRRHAYTLQQELKSRFDNQAVNLFCLSTLIPPIERSKKISAIKEKLQNGERVYVISTQLIEAGVDIDFPIVFRCISGIDSIIQAGGRANREGKHSLGCVYVFESTSESGKTPRSLGNTAKIAKEVIDNLGDRAFELEGIEKYFDILYSSSSENGFLDEKNILDEFELEAKKLNFKTVSDKFKIIDDNSSNIIIPLDEEAKTLVAQLRENTFNRMTIRKLSHYSVSVYSGEFLKLQKENVIENINGSYVLNNLHYYKNDTGLEVFSGENLNAESMFL